MEKNSAVEDFLGELKEPQVFEEPEPVVPPEPTVEPKVKQVPFHKDPKIQDYIDREIARKTESLKPPVQDDGIFKEAMTAFTKAIGDDTPEKVYALEALDRALNGLDQRASQKAIEHLQSIKDAEDDADREAENELVTALEDIEETYDVDLTSNSKTATTLRREFGEFVERIAPKDRNGDISDYPDMSSAWETFQEMKKATPAQPNRAKDLASRGMARSAETKTEIPKRVTWDTVDEFMDSLKK